MNKTTASVLAICVLMSVSKAYGQTSTAPTGAGTSSNPYNTVEAGTLQVFNNTGVLVKQHIPNDRKNIYTI